MPMTLGLAANYTLSKKCVHALANNSVKQARATLFKATIIAPLPHGRAETVGVRILIACIIISVL